MSYLPQKQLLCKTIQDVESLPARLDSGRITRAQAANLLMDFVFRNKNIFGLYKMKEDHFIDLLLEMRPKFEFIFSIYSPQKGSFGAFFYGIVRCSYRTWKRRRVRTLCAENGVLTEAVLYREEQEERYQWCEASFTPFSESEEDESAETSGKPQASLSLRAKEVSPLQRTNSRYWQENYQKIRTKIILIYALKSYAFLSEDLIQRIVRETGIEEKEFRLMCEKIEKSISAKQRRRAACKRSRDNAYYFRNMFLHQMELLDPESLQGQRIREKYQHQDEAWRSANLRLTNSMCIITPTAKTIGQILGLTSRQVLRFMRAAERNIDILRTNRYHAGYENLSGNRQHEQKARNAANLSAAYYRDTQRRRPSL